MLPEFFLDERGKLEPSYRYLETSAVLIHNSVLILRNLVPKSLFNLDPTLTNSKAKFTVCNRGWGGIPRDDP